MHNTELDESVIDWPVHMQRALDIACNVIAANPNPRVGCVITNNNTVVAEGWHIAAGHPHAEAMALGSAQAAVAGGTAFVSLEPCNHLGRTGPCSEALIEAGISTVVIAMNDPNPRVAGQGVRRLEEAGIEVFQLKDFELPAQRINPGFITRHQTGRPFVRMKLAMSMDGRTALSNGESKWITGAAARADVQKLRAASSAIVTGSGTVLADDPRLNVRVEEMDLSEAQLISNEESLKIQPLKVILDSNLRTPETARILQSGKTIIFTASADSTSQFATANDVEVRNCSNDADPNASGVELHSVLESLAAEFECNDVLLEAGPTLCGSFLKADLVDELVLYVAPKLLGSDAKALLNLTGIESMDDALDFSITELCQIGEDIKVVLRPQKV
ncbi:MAG: bifunctional diaminohydroxyphosphoribosylaminopyrimidine deaminase/5-amino-6-(5-phosphoribosylamino)uracil reductase RibD [Pseudomonadales bacterium]|nr:bifunctional diaminohydroxyphosphoribosylaminopyrimidine deaminase/5-amino-6-(5-phosphoribosylamino)uracil reductase RibD [Pseudomonadales bacterium]